MKTLDIIKRRDFYLTDLTDFYKKKPIYLKNLINMHWQGKKVLHIRLIISYHVDFCVDI